MAADRPPGHIPPEDFDAEYIVEVLNKHEVDYVVIGGMAAVIHGSPVPTADFDAVVERSTLNFERLGSALEELGTQRATDVDAFIADVEEFETESGIIDIMRTAKGIGTYEVVSAKTDLILFGNEKVRILDLPTLIAAKEANFDYNDLRHLVILREMADVRSAEVEHDRQHEDPWDR
jgi:hypothetical protein